jgi:hypothetical protein
MTSMRHAVAVSIVWRTQSAVGVIPGLQIEECTCSATTDASEFLPVLVCLPRRPQQRNSLRRETCWTLGWDGADVLSALLEG